jgi:hypothetical protein
MSRVLIAFLVSSVWVGQANAQKETVHIKQFGDWRVEVHQDAWGDEKEIFMLESGGSSIYINPQFGFVIQRYKFAGLRDFWPYCDVTQLAYRIDAGQPKKTGMGGKAASGGACASIHMPGFMLEDMRKGKKMELRAGHSNIKLAVSLNGFSDAWRHAHSLSDKPPRVESWMRPY